MTDEIRSVLSLGNRNPRLHSRDAIIRYGSFARNAVRELEVSLPRAHRTARGACDARGWNSLPS